MLKYQEKKIKSLTHFFKIVYILTTSYIDESIMLKFIMHSNREDLCKKYNKESEECENLNIVQSEITKT